MHMDYGNIDQNTLGLMKYAEWSTSSWWLQIPCRQIGVGPTNIHHANSTMSMMLLHNSCRITTGRKPVGLL